MKTFDSVKYHTTQSIVPIHEVDIGGVVYHGNYLHFYNEARDLFLKEMGFPYTKFMERGLHLTVAELKCSFRSPLFYDQSLEIKTGISWYRTRSLGIDQKIFKSENNSLILSNEASFVLVCVNNKGKAVSLPDDFVELFGA